MLLSDKRKERYFDLAEEFASWSKDPSTKVGAVAIGSHGQILSQGYNGFPRKIRDIPERLDDRETKYKFTVHGEMNCIYNATLSGVSLNQADLFIHGLPACSECAKGIVQVGIKSVYMRYPKNISDKWKQSFEDTSSMFGEAGVYYECFEVDAQSTVRRD